MLNRFRVITTVDELMYGVIYPRVMHLSIETPTSPPQPRAYVGNVGDFNGI